MCCLLHWRAYQACTCTTASIVNGVAGFLQPSRVRKLEQVGVSWQPTCTDSNRLWDTRLTQLIAFRKEHGHVQVCCYLLQHVHMLPGQAAMLWC